MNLFKTVKEKIEDTKEKVENTVDQLKNSSALKKEGKIVIDYRNCSSNMSDDFFKAYLDDGSKNIFLLSKKTIPNFSIIVDKNQNKYKIIKVGLGNNPHLNNEITTICEYSNYIPDNPFRTLINQTQNANISQEIHVVAGENSIINLNQQALIKQKMSIEQIVDSIDSESKYRFKPIENRQIFINLLYDILNKVKNIDELEEKAIKEIIDNATDILKDLIETFINKIRNG